MQHVAHRHSDEMAQLRARIEEVTAERDVALHGWKAAEATLALETGYRRVAMDRAEAAEARLATVERETIERCAKVAEGHFGKASKDQTCIGIAKRIRALAPEGSKP